MPCTPTRLPPPAPAPAPASSDTAGTKKKGKKKGNKTPPKEKTSTLPTTLPRTSLLRPSKMHFYCHQHGWVTTHGWPSGHGGHHGAPCMFMNARLSEFTPAMLAARTPDAVPNHPGSSNVQRTNVCPLPQCSPCTLPPRHLYPSPPLPTTLPRPSVTSVPHTHLPTWFATLRDRGGMSGPTKRGVSQGGNPTGLEMGAGGVEVALARCQTRWGPTSVTRHRPRSGSSKTRPIRSVPSRVGEGRAEVGRVGRGGSRSDSAK
jgi:hypothetical protein